ncbi:MAG: hypothetical protein ABIR91_05255 [Candidatus Saccharimonadales bacterium]
MNKSSSTNEKKNELSGISIALAFGILGLAYAYLLQGVYGAATQYIAGTLILVGSVGLLIELVGLLKSSNLRLDNGGVGLVLLIPTAIGAYYAHTLISGWVSGLVIAVLSIVALFGLAGCIDLIVSMIENIKSGKNLIRSLTGFIKVAVLVISSTATIIIALRQIIG